MTPDSIKYNNKRRYSKVSNRPMAEINVTPFIDVMLVVLVIFIVTAPLMQTAINIDLPEEQLNVDTSERDFFVSIDKNNSIFFNEKKVSEKELLAIAKDMKNQKNNNIFIRADKSVNYGSLIHIIAILQQEGIEKIGLVSAPKE